MKHKLHFKRFFASLLLLAVSTLSWAYSFEVDGIYYNFDNFTYGNNVAVTYKDGNYNSYSGTVVIPSSVEYYEQNYTVTRIGYRAFSGCSGLTSIKIPNSVTIIDTYAFYGCSGLTSVTIPNSVTGIGHYAFESCSGLTSITIPNSVTGIAPGAFGNCSGLTSIIIPGSVTSIGEWAFEGCSGLTSIKIPNSVTSIGSNAFRNCSGLTSVTIPESVTSIGDRAFGNCSGLTSVTCLAENVPATASNAFYNVPQSTVILYVPEISVNAYKTTYPWSLFGNIVGMDPTVVEEVKSNKNFRAKENAPIYDLMGRRLQQKPANGYYIQGGKKYLVK